MENPLMQVMANAAGLSSASIELPVTIADSFPKQWEFVEHQGRFLCVMCSRRAAKTTGAIRRVTKRSQEQPGRRTLYIHHTRGLGKAQFFSTGDKRKPGLIEFLEQKNIGVAYKNETDVNVRLGNGSFVQVVGCDDIKDVGKKLGFFWDEIIIDECQEFHDEILVLLVDKTILPTLIDNAGVLILMGTPADVEVGLWYDTIVGKRETADGERRPLAQQLRWTLLDNPFIPRENIVSTMGLRGYVIDFQNPENNCPLVRREIFGHQVIDASKLEYEYLAGRNDWDVSGIPLVDSPDWQFSLGVDIGGAREGNDKDACVVFGWLKTDPEHRIWERESWEERQDSEEFVTRLLATYMRWRPMVSLCADTGGAGANKMLEALAKRFRGMEFTPKPTSVETSMRLLNDELRSGRMRLDPFGLIARDCKLCTKGGVYHSDIMAAARYAHHGAYNFLGKEADEAKRKGETPDEKLRRERRERRSAEIRHLQDPWTAMGGWRQ